MTTLLIIEDEDALRDTLAANLRSEDYTIHTAAEGREGLDQIRAIQPDLVILDVMLPEIDGLTLCRMVRRDESIAHIPIIMLTARGTEGDKMVGLDSGADDYMTKPFGIGELLARIRAVLRRDRSRGQSAATKNLLESGGVRIDLAAYRAYRGEDELQLSAKEFKLLVELMKNEGAVLSRDLILSRVWGYDYYGDGRTVDVHIRWLREKIENDPSKPQHIKTVRGVGYRFEG